jgi:hypothetical protein
MSGQWFLDTWGGGIAHNVIIATVVVIGLANRLLIFLCKVVLSVPCWGTLNTFNTQSLEATCHGEDRMAAKRTTIYSWCTREDTSTPRHKSGFTLGTLEPIVVVLNIPGRM